MTGLNPMTTRSVGVIWAVRNIHSLKNKRGLIS